jgi:hypothetical protein
VKRLYNEAMEPEVLSWDDSSNNRFLISGKGAWIANPPSPYLTAKTRNMPIAEEIYFQLMPAGPKGRHTTTFIRSIGIWKFSKNIEPAKEFTKFFFAEENYNDYINAALAFDAPVFKSMEDHPVWKIDPKYEPFKESGRYGHLYGWPAPGDERSQQVRKKLSASTPLDRARTEMSTRCDGGEGAVSQSCGTLVERELVYAGRFQGSAHFCRQHTRYHSPAILAHLPRSCGRTVGHSRRRVPARCSCATVGDQPLVTDSLPASFG